ncbi:hypothetical protein F4820DRAFT_464644 [Hypoxylon rubiginosum]|uniref:Uncharacterized protein n=1 Tax=Hypoxylon rubiginosum TaxID=110542 RepID=A0ACB9ZD17_9PEZI|nr:hypothetical protein F4820DRAFT_464644 [Hypoxylon rubiginosum]
MATQMPHQQTSPSSPTPSPSPRFTLAFRVVSDGLETSAACALDAARSHALSGGSSGFPLFASLPPELRLKIWEYLIAPRVVAVACLDAEAPPPDEEPEEPWAAFPDLEPVAPDPVPALLLVSRETRALALSRYEPAFAWKTPHVMLSSSSLPQNSSSSSSTPTTATWSRPSAWFNYNLDALYLLGQLEPCDSYGFNSPMAYFLDRQEARRVRRLAVAFAALKYGETAPQHVFGALWHCVDRFPRAAERLGGGRVLVAVTPRDEYTNALMGGLRPLVEGGYGEDERRDVAVARGSAEDEVNIVQKTWRDWYRGSIVTSSLANVQFELVREEDLPQRIAQSADATRGRS